MVISSLIVKCLRSFEDSLPNQLEQIKGVSVERVINGDIILVLENELVNDAVQLVESKIGSLPGVTGVYPVYIAMDEDFPKEEV
ncbi:chaperone NapD [Desulfitobacterium sp. THU1]|uniref:chaperone NapD n=1 Tax=Desulfitobacterium sp. THU1 TaxID=3138072 RepID=UPI00311F1839